MNSIVKVEIGYDQRHPYKALYVIPAFEISPTALLTGTSKPFIILESEAVATINNYVAYEPMQAFTITSAMKSLACAISVDFIVKRILEIISELPISGGCVSFKVDEELVAMIDSNSRDELLKQKEEFTKIISNMLEGGEQSHDNK